MPASAPTSASATSRITVGRDVRTGEGDYACARALGIAIRPSRIFRPRRGCQERGRVISTRPAMTRTALLVLLARALPSTVAGCGGGSGAALTYSVFPGDRVVTGRRLEGLARTFENSYGCTETDTINIVGLAPQTYNVDGCAH